MAGAARRGRAHGVLRHERFPDHRELDPRPASGALRRQARPAAVAADAHRDARHGAGRRPDGHNAARRRVLQRARHVGLHRQQRGHAHAQARAAGGLHRQPVAGRGQRFAVDAADGAARLRRPLHPAAARRGQAALPLALGGRAGRSGGLGQALGGHPGRGVGGLAAERADRVAGGVPGGVRAGSRAQPLPRPALARRGCRGTRRAGADAEQPGRLVPDDLRRQLRGHRDRPLLAFAAGGAGGVGQRQLRRLRLGLPDPAAAGDGGHRQPVPDAGLRRAAGVRDGHAVVEVRRGPHDAAAALHHPGAAGAVAQAVAVAGGRGARRGRRRTGRRRLRRSCRRPRWC